LNHYPHHIGDYDSDTAHLEWVEDMAYTRMLRVYYRTERPLPVEVQAVCRLVRAKSKGEKAAVKAMLDEFFVLEGDGWHNKRCDQELARYQEKSSKASASAAARWSQSERNANASSDAMRTHSEGNASQNQNHNHNQEKEQKPPAARASRLQVEALPDEWRFFCQAERSDLDPERTFAKFCDYWKAKPGKQGTKLDWLATWRNWVRQERKPNGEGNAKFNVHAYSRKKLAESMATGAVGEGAAQEILPALPPEVH